jgi:hypothetical protein
MFTVIHVQHPLMLSNFKDNWIFWTVFWTISEYQILWQSAGWEPSRSMRTDGRTYMTKLIATLRNFAKAPKNVRNYEFVLHKPLHVMVVTFRTNKYIIRHDLPSTAHSVDLHKYNLSVFRLANFFVCCLASYLVQSDHCTGRNSVRKLSHACVLPLLLHIQGCW